MGEPVTTLLSELTGSRTVAEQGFILSILEQSGPSAGPLAQVVPSRHQADLDMLRKLTWRESEVLELLSRHMTNKEIGQELCISPETVKKHVANLCEKFHAPNRRQAVMRARQMGVMPLVIDGTPLEVSQDDRLPAPRVPSDLKGPWHSRYVIDGTA